jgi:hypothetical protein
MNPSLPTHHTDEDLIAHGWDEDVWFHADNLSSAHIYVRLPEGEDWEKMTKELLVDCAQLTKANSIEGMFFWSEAAGRGESGLTGRQGTRKITSRLCIRRGRISRKTGVWRLGRSGSRTRERYVLSVIFCILQFWCNVLVCLHLRLTASRLSVYMS